MACVYRPDLSQMDEVPELRSVKPTAACVSGAGFGANMERVGRLAQVIQMLPLLFLELRLTPLDLCMEGRLTVGPNLKVPEHMSLCS